MLESNSTTDKPITLAHGKYLKLLKEDTWEYVERINCTGIAVIVALTQEKEVILVEQYRRPVKCKVIEFPAGLVGDVEGHEHESIEHAAKRELLEETGFEADNLVLLTEGPPSSGLSTEIVSFFGALNVKKTGDGGGDGTESIIVHLVPVSDIHGWLEQKRENGFLVDPKIYGGIYLIGKMIGLK
jgi:ADP-ribose pyrophosphatase